MIKILLNVLTHGDELIGERTSTILKNKYPTLIGNGVDIHIANVRAYEEHKRYIYLDLNRVFPGKKDGVYEEQRAYELMQLIKTYDLVIDVHSTESGMENAVIVTKVTPDVVSLIEMLRPQYVLYMAMQPDRSLIGVARSGIAFEMGNDSSDSTTEKTTQGIECILSHYKYIQQSTPSFGFNTEYYKVIHEVHKPKGARLVDGISNFKIIKKGQVFAITADGEHIISEKEFYPVIFGSTNYETIFGFAAEKLERLS